MMSADNNMDPGLIPDHLPELTDMEQMLISPVHISMHMAHIKGAQYRYKGHVMTFLRDIPDVVTVLPRLPQHCHVVMIRPKQVLVNGAREDGTTRQFRRSFTVRRWAIQVSFSLSKS
jgi:ATP-dependent DNA helicase PIF1